MMESKKLAKKQRRKEALLLRREPELGLEFQTKPSVQVLVGNGGLVHGLSRAALDILLPAALDICMPPGKDYAFATFSTLGEAEQAVTACNGVSVQSLPELAPVLPASLIAGPPLHLYLSYIHHVPPGLNIYPPPSSTCVAEKSEKEERGMSGVVPGLILLPEFISREEEARLVGWVDSMYQSGATVTEQLKQRQVLHYGYQFNYHTNSVDHSQPLPGRMPSPVQDLIGRIVLLDHVHHIPDQVTINRYPPGAGTQV